MARITLFYSVTALISVISHAGEITIENRSFFVEKLFSATAMPSSNGELLKLSPKIWTNFKIQTIASHGSKVAQNEVLIRFETEEIEKKIEDTRRIVETSRIELAQAELNRQILSETAARRLEMCRRSAEIAKEENTYFTQTRRKASEETAAQELKRSQQILAGQREELKQLTKMYGADEITENAEEITLIHQRDAVATAEFSMRMEMLDHQRTIETLLPREAKSLADSEREAATQLQKAEVEIPQSIELAKLEVIAQKTEFDRASKTLADLLSDRSQFEMKASCAGCFYHGPVENGRWTTDPIVKSLIPRGSPPLQIPFASVIPTAATLGLTAFLDDATARSMRPDITGSACLAGREDLDIPVKLIKISNVPAVDGSYRADFAATWPRECAITTGATALIRVIIHQQVTTIAVPTKALVSTPAGWTVEVKLADGKTERRSVKRGLSAKDETEILAGLEIGQVILVP